jgi:addiction module HigA family antidote
MMKNMMRPLRPGKVLKEDVLDALGLSASALARHLNVPPNRITGIVKGTRAITADTALRLSRFLGTSPDFWMGLQQAYDIKLAQKAAGREIALKVKPLEIKDAA